MLDQVELACSAVVRLTVHEEDYFIQLPDVALAEPLSATCRPTLTGGQLARKVCKYSTDLEICSARS